MLPALVARLEAHAHAARGAFAPTERALRKASAAFTGWAASQDLEPLPALPATVSAFVYHLAASGSAPASIRPTMWAIGAMHWAIGAEDPSCRRATRSGW
ncbi:hypothetical protein D9599_25780 [Roseomonas sp. KE2513]|nr:hypothetical protein [Roseomonas sp. KE2513]